LIFDGDDDVTISSSSADFNSPVFTIMMWIKADAAITAGSVLFSKWASSKGFKLAGDAGNNLALTLDGTTISASAGSGPGTDTAHVAATYDIHTNILKLYINGEPVRYTTANYLVSSNSEDVVIGDGFSGVIDDVRFYNTEISNATIKAISNNGYRSNEGMYMLRASNGNTVHFNIDGSYYVPRYFPIFQISNYWAEDKPEAIYYNDRRLTEDTHYLANLDGDNNLLYVGFNTPIRKNDLYIYI
ncbi:MAG: LamG domain-containing protein, partial [Planctomycetes bacterium]|nr:LamG domain-containing protein [Planctomycetota bacterium]